MNWDYISGFFDADGSITLSSPGNSKYKTVFLTFHNNERVILEKIEGFIKNELNIKGVIVEKKPKSEKHSPSFDLKYDYFEKSIAIAKELSIYHPKKKHRIEIAKKLAELIPRNGKYTEELLGKRIELEKLFFEK